MLRLSARALTRLAPAAARRVPAARMLAASAPPQVSFDFDTNEHRSNSEELVAQWAPIEVEGTVAMCNGGGGAMGHPIEFIQLDRVQRHTPATCKYCGLRFVQKKGSH